MSEFKKMLEEARKLAESNQNTPLNQLTRKILNEERRYLYSEQNVMQRRKNIKGFIEDARKNSEILTGEDK